MIDVSGPLNQIVRETATATYAKDFDCAVWRKKNYVLQGAFELAKVDNSLRKKPGATSAGVTDREVVESETWFDFAE